MKKKLLLLITCFVFCILNVQGQKFSTFYYQRATLFEVLPVTTDDIIFLGNSITNGAEWSELFANPHVKNRGISGDTTIGVYQRLDAILIGHPSKIFLLIGINDVSRGLSVDTIVKHIGMIIEKIKRDSPNTRLYLQSLLPVTDYYKMFNGHTSHADVIPEINRRLAKLTVNEEITYIDLFSQFMDPNSGKLRVDLTNDGLHLLGKGYLIWKKLIDPYINE